ncbi:NRAMP family divalent metal transporter [Lewinella sp. IMCC34183]|uniref:NRAMP family divalent metal transporter n=1 Tax=Lewinella sp. IMCC34183 TaxID=2248762 RepID=UPI001300ABB9|nr:divalent metal cation transporter [Lewinella sp. IMCC34183]
MATATRAGTEGGLAYLAPVLLAAVAGYVFMEMAARVTLVSRQSLGEQLGRAGRWLPRLTFAAVAFGCLAYQAGNLLGALGGLRLLFALDRLWLLPGGGAIVALLWAGNSRLIGRVMAAVVALMGLLFVVGAVSVLAGGDLSGRTFAPVDATVLLGLLGTTIVPYNFFLAAGLGVDGDLITMRRGLLLSFAIGLVITASIVTVGATAISFLTFDDLAAGLEQALGAYGRLILAVGLFAAGFSSATTAPYAAAMAGRGLLGGGDRWDTGGRYFRLTWLSVLGCGLAVALLQLDIVGVILLAQLINGLLLPFIALVVLVLANRRELLGEDVNSVWQNVLGGAVLLFLFYKTGEYLVGLW